MRCVISRHIFKRFCQKRNVLKGTDAEDGLRQKADLATGNNILVVVAEFAESYHILCVNGLSCIPCIIMVAEMSATIFCE